MEVIIEKGGALGEVGSAVRLRKGGDGVMPTRKEGPKRKTGQGNGSGDIHQLKITCQRKERLRGLKSVVGGKKKREGEVLKEVYLHIKGARVLPKNS